MCTAASAVCLKGGVVASALLQTERLTRRFGGVVAADRIALDIAAAARHADPGEIAAAQDNHALAGDPCINAGVVECLAKIIGAGIPAEIGKGDPGVQILPEIDHGHGCDGRRCIG